MHLSASRAGCPVVPSQLNHRLDASAGQALAQPAGIECLVADKSQAAMLAMRPSQLVMS